MQFHFHANQSHFHKNGFALRLALKQRHKGTRKWPIVCSVYIVCPSVLSCSNLKLHLFQTLEVKNIFKQEKNNASVNV